MGKGTFRTEKYDGYKSNRIEAPLELIPQFDLVKEVVAELGVPNIGLAGYEADDCIGTLASCYSDNSEVYILTGDHDMLQLIDENVKVVIMKKGRSNYKVYDLAELLEDKGLTPRQVIDLKGFMGDTSDNYPGVKGIGEKTALKLLTEYGTVEGVIENLHLLPKGVRSKIEADLDMLHLSRELAEIRCDVPVVCELAEALWQLQRETAARKFQELEFGSLMHLIAEVQDERGIVQIELGDLG
ncbi:5'-3' exonuclease [compost metagenome]